MDRVTQFAYDAVTGKIKGVGKTEMLAYKRHLNDLEKSKKPRYQFTFDESRAERYLKYFEKCINPDTGKPFELLPHQIFDYGCLMGWVEKETGERRFTESLSLQARGATKSTGCSVLSGYFLTSDRTYPPGAPDEGYLSNAPVIQLMAVDKTQVAEVWEPLYNIVNATPWLLARIEAKKTYIRGKKTGGVIKVLSKDVHNKQGAKPNLAIIDEYADHPNSKRVDTVRGGFGKKAGGLLYIISTAGDNSAKNPCKTEYDYAKGVLSGKIKADRYFAMIRELDPSDDIHDKSNWLKANAMYRYNTPYSKRLWRQVCLDYDRAFNGKIIDFDKQHEFKTRRLNMWDVETQHKWLDSKMLAKLRRCVVPRDEYEELTRGLKKIEGLDLSKSRDLTARGEVLLLPDGRWAINAKGYIPGEDIETKSKNDNVNYEANIRAGNVMTCGSDAIDLTLVGEDMVKEEYEREQDIIEITYDPYKAYQLALDLEKGEKYIYQTPSGAVYQKQYKTIEIPQTLVHLHIPTEKLYNAILDENIVVCENDVLMRHFENCYKVVGKGGDLVKVGKKDKDSTDRIDMVAAIIDAFARSESLETVNDIRNTIEQNGRYYF